MATLAHREVGQTGQNYLRSLFAVGFQGMLILVCVAIYAVLVQGIVTSGDPIGAVSYTHLSIDRICSIKDWMLLEVCLISKGEETISP